MKRIRLKTLGGLVLQDHRGATLRVSTRKAAGLLAFLATQPGRRFRREHLANLLWGDKTEIQAKHSLSQAVSDLKRHLGPDILCACGDLLWANDAVTEADVLEVAKLAERPETSALLEAEELYQGEFLVGMEQEQAEFDTWIASERERLRQLAQRTIATLLVRQSSDADVGQALRFARAALALDPYDEVAHCAILRVHARQGRRALVASHFRKLRCDFAVELGIEPSDETVALYHELMACSGPVGISPQQIDDYAFVIEQLPHPVVVTDTENRIVGWNRLSEEQLGFSKGEVQGRAPNTVLAPAAAPNAGAHVMRTAIEQGRWTGTITLKARDGKLTTQNRVVAPLYSPDGRLVGAFGYGAAGEQAVEPARLATGGVRRR